MRAGVSGLRRVGSVLADLADSSPSSTLPLVILAIGVPVALLFRLGMWIAGTF